MHLSVLFIIFGVAMVTCAAEDPPGLNFVGIGYNLLKGNPEGIDLSVGGVDPGLLTTRKIFKLTRDRNKISVRGRKFTVLDRVSFVPLQSCVNRTAVVFGTKSYQDELRAFGAGAWAGYETGLWNVAFSLSSGYQKADKETLKSHNVFLDEQRVCHRGRFRHLLDLNRDQLKKNFPVTEKFATAVCRLPKLYNQKEYFNFIENWGTHVVMEVDVGEKTTTRYRSSWSEVTKFAMDNIGNSVSVEGGYEGFSASLSVKVETFKKSMNANSTFGSNKTVFRTGGADLSEPIKVKLMPIYLAMQLPFITPQHCEHPTKSFFVNVRKNTRRLLTNYPSLKNTPNATDPNVRIPFTWPEGTYGLPMPKTGCPEQEGFSWHTGTRFQDTEDTYFPNNVWSSPYDLAGTVGKSSMEQKFCMKTRSQTSEFSLSWPKGNYCIFKKGDKCPTGFTEGSIHWDDEDSDNKNSINGTLPEGSYDHDTTIFFCCRSDGIPTNAIILPITSPFVLLRAGSQCQPVRGMNVTEEYFIWDTEDNSNKDSISGSVPSEAKGRYIVLHYCYYYRPNVRIPLTWPEGTYGLPMPKTGCPEQEGFSWHTGTRFQDTEDTYFPNNVLSSPYDLAGTVGKSSMEQKFCMKTQSQTSEFSLSWPKGNYCIFKKGDKCPTGFTEGSIHWDDVDSDNKNSINGTLPEGSYDHDTTIFFCCRSDGIPTNAIILPTISPFVLLRAGSQCQYVRGMNVTEEYFSWDTEDNQNKDSISGSVPSEAKGRYIVLHYCYYYR